MDSKYGFSLAIPEGWDTSIKKDKYKTRLILTKKRYEIPSAYRHAPGYTQIPKATVYVDTTSMQLNMFIDSLLSDEYKSDQKNKMLEEFKILFGDFVQKTRTKTSLGETDGMLISGERRYTLRVQKAGFDSDEADLITDFYGGTIFSTKKDNLIFIIHFISENRYFSTENQDFLKLLNGFTILKEKEEKE